MKNIFLQFLSVLSKNRIRCINKSYITIYIINKFQICLLVWLHVYLLISHTFHCNFFLQLIVGGPKPCSSNPCGANSVCQDTPNGAGYICTCKEGYTGQPFRGCTGKHILRIYVFCLFLKLRILRTTCLSYCLNTQVCHYVPRKKITILLIRIIFLTSGKHK